MKGWIHAPNAFRVSYFRPHTSRIFSTTACQASGKQSAEVKSFSNTLRLPKTTFPLWPDPSEVREIQKKTGEDLYRWQRENAKGPLFVLHDGPPYANGNLHMGHALNKILKDIINRYNVLLGRRVHYIPGWDCHGLPIENKALQELGQDSLTAPASTIRSAAEATAKREIESQKSQFQHFGIMADWSPESTYRTLDHNYEIRQLRIFKKMVEKGLIYRHYRPVHYSPSSRSALAEAELVYKDDHVSHSVYVSFELDRKAPSRNSQIQGLLASSESVRLLVWTTTPWTLTANMGIAVNNDMIYTVLRCADGSQIGPHLVVVAKDRIEPLKDILGTIDIVAEVQGSDLVDAQYIPLFSAVEPSTQSLKIIHAVHVTSESGTGLVHCAPAHGAEDYQAFLAQGLISSTNNMICHVDGAGKFSADVAEIVGSHAGSLVGQEVLTGGSRAVVDILRTMGALIKVQRIKHRYPYDWKTDKPIIVTATSQWFANLADIKDDALTALDDVKFFPSISRNRLESFVRSRSEWCISRQRVWGVPIPALLHMDTDRSVLDSSSLSHILSVLENKGVAYWWNGPIEEFVPTSLVEPGRPVAETWRKGTDTMDVWFDSGSSWSMLSEMGVGNENEGRMFHADVCVEGSDQHRGWFQSQLLTAIGSATSSAEAVSPYGTLITHGMVLDEAGRKMSKSLGNIISPLTIVSGGEDAKKNPAYGADALRLWVATVEYWRDTSIGPTVLSQAAGSARKIRNSARFALGNIGDEETRNKMEPVPQEEMGLAERYVMHELYNLERTAHEGYISYNFPKIVNSLTTFANITLSSFYFDITKDCLYANDPTSHERRAITTVLEQILKTMTSVLAPILPHLAEEIHMAYQPDGSSFFMKPWKSMDEKWNDPQAAEEMSELLRLRGFVLSLLEKARGDKRIKSPLEAEVDIILPDSALGSKLATILRREETFLKTFFITSDAVVTDEGSLGTFSPEWVYSETLSIPDSDGDLAIRVRPATLHKCPRCWAFTRPEADVLCQRCAGVTSH